MGTRQVPLLGWQSALGIGKKNGIIWGSFVVVVVVGVVVPVFVVLGFFSFVFSKKVPSMAHSQPMIAMLKARLLCTIFQIF